MMGERMFSDKIKVGLAGVALFGATFGLASAASAGVVVKSTGPSAGEYPVGRQVADNTTITLQARSTWLWFCSRVRTQWNQSRRSASCGLTLAHWIVC